MTARRTLKSDQINFSLTVVDTTLAHFTPHHYFLLPSAGAIVSNIFTLIP
jgi:hypothetical protein